MIGFQLSGKKCTPITSKMAMPNAYMLGSDESSSEYSTVAAFVLVVEVGANYCDNFCTVRYNRGTPK